MNKPIMKQEVKVNEWDNLPAHVLAEKLNELCITIDMLRNDVDSLIRDVDSLIRGDYS